MAVEIIYAVVRQGVQIMTCASAEEARQHDLMLDQAEALQALISNTPEITALLGERELEQLCVALARQRQDVLQALGVKEKASKEKEEKRSRASRKQEAPASSPLFADNLAAVKTEPAAEAKPSEQSAQAA